MVVRPQRCSVLPDRRVPWHDVLFRAASGPPAALELSVFDRQFLGPDFGLHVGRLASPDLYRAAGLGAVRRGGVFSGATDAQLGFGRQRTADIQWFLAPSENGSGRQIHGAFAGFLRRRHI